MTSNKANRVRELFGLTLVITIFTLGLAIIEATKVPGPLTFPGTWSTPALILAALLLGANVLLRIKAPAADQLILPLCAFLSALGLLALNALDISFSEQLTWVALGLAAALAVVLTIRHPDRLGNYKYVAGALGIILLMAPIFIGTVRGGSKLWLVFGGYSFQPAEPAKILLTIFLAAYLAEKKEVLAAGGRKLFGFSWPEPRHFGPLIVTWVISLAILVFERDLGSSFIFFSLFLMMLYIATGRLAYVTVGLLLFSAGAAAAYRIFTHVAARVDVWLAPLPTDVSGSAYQVAQSLFSLDAGGLSGTGLGAGLLGRAINMPAVHTDFVFSALGEELGLAGTAAILLAYLVFMARGFRAGRRSNNDFLALLAIGLATVVGIQALVIIGGVLKVVPLTGVTLPFVSYGGSSIVSSFIMAGLLLSISEASG